MASAGDIFELSVDVLYRCCGWIGPEKYFTFELDIIVGTLIKMIAFIYSFFLLDILSPLTFGAYYFIWQAQALFIIQENSFIFQGNSGTKRRQYFQKYLGIVQSVIGLIFFGAQSSNDQNDINTEDQDQTDQESQKYNISSPFWIFFFILFSFLVLDVFEFIKICACNTEFQNYQSVGFSEYFLKYRLIGGILGIIVMLIIYLIFRNEEGNYQHPVYQYILPGMMLSEIIILSASVYQLCQKPKKEKLIADYKTKNKLKMKKWYCIIVGLCYGIVEVIVSIAILSIIGFILMIRYFFSYFFCCILCCECKWEDIKIIIQYILSANEIIEYEIVCQNQQQEEHLNPTV